MNPYLAIETLEDLSTRGLLPPGVTFDKALKNFKKAVNKGLLKVFSKMGISTLQSYRGAQIFEAIGLNKTLIEKYFTGTPSRIEGVGLDVLAREAQMKHEYAFRPATRARHHRMAAARLVPHARTQALVVHFSSPKRAFNQRVVSIQKLGVFARSE